MPGPATSTGAVSAMAARQSDALVQTVGLNLHLLDGQTAYGDFPRMLRQLKTLGVRYVRTDFSPTRTDLASEISQLSQAGIQTDLTMSDTGDVSALPAAVQALMQLPAGAVNGVEPMNEWNYVGPANWAAEDRVFQRRMYALVRAQPSLDNVSVIGPSLALRQGYLDVGNLSSYLDYGNLHLYPGGARPTNRVDSTLTAEQAVAGTKPVVVSETGYHNALHCTCTHPPISEQAAAVYEPRLFLDYFLQPTVKRVYQYELYDTTTHADTDHNGSFGLVDYDGSTPKPSFNALRNLISLAADPGPGFTTHPLKVSVSPRLTSTSDPVDHVLVQRRDGSYLLFVWSETSLWNPVTRKARSLHQTTGTITFGQPISSATVYQPSASAAPKSVFRNPTSFTVPLAGQVDAIKIVPAG